MAVDMAGFELLDGEPFTAFGTHGRAIRHDVYASGEGPPVVLMHELDGLRDAVITLAVEVRAAGYRVYLPRFFGTGREGDVLAQLKGVGHVCVRREFVGFFTGRTSPVAGWVRALAARAQRDDPQRRQAGVIGMCLTGGIVLATIADDAVAAGVAAQPSLPWAACPGFLASAARRRDLGLGSAHLEAARSTDKPLLVLRFDEDTIAPAERADEIATTFANVSCPTISAGSATPPKSCLDGRAHPTLTGGWRADLTKKNANLVAASRDAITRTLEFLRDNVAVPGGTGS